MPHKQLTPLIPPNPFKPGDPPQKNAELTIFALGENQDEIIPCLRMLGEFNLRKLRELQVSLPRTLELPRSYYDKSDTFVAMLRSTGTKFLLRSYSWVCPDEMASDQHSCRPTCSVMQISEDVAS